MKSVKNYAKVHKSQAKFRKNLNFGFHTPEMTGKNQLEEVALIRD